MANPYPAEFWTQSRDARSLVVRLGGYLNFTDNANMPAGAVQVTDGSHTVAAATELDFTSGATVTDLGSGVAGIAITGGGGGGTALSSFSFAYNTASLNAGVSTGITATSGKMLIVGFPLVATAWNGTTPLLDFGVGVSGGGHGIAHYSSAPIDMSNTTPSGGGANEADAWIGIAVWNATGTIEVWVSQDGTKGGTAPGASQGSATFYVLQTT